MLHHPIVILSKKEKNVTAIWGFIQSQGVQFCQVPGVASVVFVAIDVVTTIVVAVVDVAILGVGEVVVSE